MGLDELLQEVKAVALQPVAIGILRATANSAKQVHGVRYQALTAKVRGLTTDCKYILPCPHAPVGEQVCAKVRCRGIDYTSEVIKDILFSGIYDQEVRGEVFGDSAIEDKSVNELVRFVEAKEAARDAAWRQTGSDHGSSSLLIQEEIPPRQQQPTATTSAKQPANWHAPKEALLHMWSGFLRLRCPPERFHQPSSI